MLLWLTKAPVQRVLQVSLLPLQAKLHVPRVLLVLILVAWQSRHA